jgi:hypothetical protein
MLSMLPDWLRQGSFAARSGPKIKDVYKQCGSKVKKKNHRVPPPLSSNARQMLKSKNKTKRAETQTQCVEGCFRLHAPYLNSALASTASQLQTNVLLLPV